jgi:hypothetical protein
MAQPTAANDNKPKKQLTKELDRFEAQLNELRILYEQFFVDVLPQPPLKQHEAIVRLIRQLLKAPFKNSQSRFRLRMLVQRYQSYNTYWERVNKQREDGTYTRDLFKAEMRAKMIEDAEKAASRAGAAERSLRQLFNSYESAIRKSGQNADKLNFDAFKNTMLKRAKQLKKEQGVKKLSYKVVVKDGKVTIKASAKK